MADINKSIAIIITGDNADATAKVAALEQSLKGLDQSTGGKEVAKGIASVGEAAEKSIIPTKQLGESLKKLGEDAGVPKDVLTGLEGILGKIGTPVGGAAVIAAGALTAFAIVAVKAGSDVRDFKLAIDNVSGGAVDSGKAFDFVRKAIGEVEISLQQGLEQYQKFTIGIQGTGIAAQVAEDAFIGIQKAIQGVDGTSQDAQRALDTFAKVVRNGSISTKELDLILANIPGGLRLLEQATGQSADQLRVLAKEGALGADVIAAFASTLKNADYGNISPVKDAFTDLLNTIRLFAIDLGGQEAAEAGLWAISKALRLATTAITIAGAELVALGKTLANIKFSIETRDLDGFIARQREIGAETKASIDPAIAKLLGLQKATDGLDTSKASDEYKKLTQSLNDVQNASIKLAEDSIKSIGKLTESQTKLAFATAEVKDVYSAFGINVNRVNRNVIDDLEKLIQFSGSTGKEISAALKIVFPKIENADELQRLVGVLQQAANSGKITWEEYGKEVDAASKAFLKNTGYVKENSDALKKQAADTKLAQENAAKLKLELEKLASNERIKLIEAKVQIDVARIQADAQKVIAAFDSINKVIDSSNDLLGELFSILGKGNLDWGAIRLIEDQINKENEIKKGQLELQKELTAAQIRNLNAQAAALAKGDAIIKVDGAGLQPELEAFMWKILQTIQVKANRDGLPFLLGV